MTTADYENHISLWKKQSVLKLADHFHEYCKEDSFQHRRVHHFEMDYKFLDLFTKLKEIEKMKICLALKSLEATDDFTFYPILEIECKGNTKIMYFPLEPVAFSELRIQSEFVPGIFKEMIQDNWNKLDIMNIDDLFIAQARTDDGVSLNQMVRVHEFIINEDMIEFINAINREIETGSSPLISEPNIQKIRMYPGVDMNKFGNKELISFTPVLGFGHLQDPNGVLNKHGVLEVTQKETFIEYSRPCPPTCKPPDL